MQERDSSLRYVATGSESDDKSFTPDYDANQPESQHRDSKTGEISSRILESGAVLPVSRIIIESSPCYHAYTKRLLTKSCFVESTNSR